MSGTPEKILEHLLEMMRLDSQFTESGTAQYERSSTAILMPSNIINTTIICYEGFLSSALPWLSLCPLPCCSALTCLFSSLISHTSQSWSNYSRLCGYIWFSFACRGDRDWAMWFRAPWLWTLFDLLLLWHHMCLTWAPLSLSLFCSLRLGLRRLCPHALCLHPKQSTVSSVDGPISFQLSTCCVLFIVIWKPKITTSTTTLFWSLTSAHLPCPGLAGLRTGKAGLHAQQQAQGDPPGDAVGRSARRSPAGGGWFGGLPGGQLLDRTAHITPVATAAWQNRDLYNTFWRLVISSQVNSFIQQQ